MLDGLFDGGPGGAALGPVTAARRERLPGPRPGQRGRMINEGLHVLRPEAPEAADAGRLEPSGLDPIRDGVLAHVEVLRRFGNAP
jgi:hypothetical protein